MGDIDELCRLSAVEALRRFADRSLSPVELLDALYARADAVEPEINAWSDRRTEQAYTAARAAEARWAAGGDATRRLDGIPVAMKEEQPIAGEPWRLGSLLLEHEVASVTHPLYERLTDAGAVVHARTTTPEFSCAGFTHSRLWGLTKNPWNHEFTCGGSSGGSGASLASLTTPLATGSDIGGSIRVPSAQCGLIGFKPPHGRVPTLPPFNLDTYSHDGPMGRTVADVALLQNVIAGAHPIDHTSMRFPPVLPLEPDPITGMRIAVARTIGDVPVAGDVDANTTRIIEALRAAGATVVEVELPIPRQQVLTTMMIHFAAIFGASITAAAGDRPELLTPYAAHFAARSAAVGTQHTYYEGLEMETAIHLAIAETMAGFDALVCPTLGTNQLRAGDDYVDHGLTIDGVELPFYFEAGMTTVFNIASKHPVLNVPSGRGHNGAPTGVQIVAPTYDDATAFRVGAALERELGWWHDPSWQP
jgi:aspartyl-tRNA(Asn)/glutamyl-tRNA(Gln) amidotransferase subunit A